LTDHHYQTKLVHAGTRRSQYNEVSEAIYLTQGFVYESAEQAEARFEHSTREEFIYARYGNPTVAMFEDRIAALEGAEDAFATASGMAAVNGALFSQLKAGDHIVSAKQLFGSCLYIVETLLPRFGIEVDLVDGTDLAAWKKAIRPDTKLCFLEAVSNPTLEVIDIKGVAEIAHANDALVVVDNVFATPKDFVRGVAEPYLKHTGGAMSPFNAWVMLKGMETLDLRCRAQAASSLKIAEALKDHPKLERAIYPHLDNHPQFDLAKQQMEAGGTVLAMDIKGGKEAAFRFLNALELILISNNLGDAKSLVTHPATTTHQRLSEETRSSLGITDGLVRVSIGLENANDLLADIETALAKI